MLASLPLVVGVVVEVVVCVWMVLDVANRIVSTVGVFIVVVFGLASQAHLWSPRSLATCWRKILHVPTWRVVGIGIHNI
jgi:uncharacterized membrane protein YphA (DoxX/SURF4 family)